MQAKGLESDPRYNQLLSIMRNKPPGMDHPDPTSRISSPGSSMGHGDPGGGGLMGGAMSDMGARTSSTTQGMMSNMPGRTQPKNFSTSQLHQLRAQIMAYKLIARTQPLPEHIRLAVQGKAPPPPPGHSMQKAPIPPQQQQISVEQNTNQPPQVQPAGSVGKSSSSIPPVPSSSPAPNQTAYNVPGMTAGVMIVVSSLMRLSVYILRFF